MLSMAVEGVLWYASAVEAVRLSVLCVCMKQEQDMVEEAENWEREELKHAVINYLLFCVQTQRELQLTSGDNLFVLFKTKNYCDYSSFAFSSAFCSSLLYC